MAPIILYVEDNVANRELVKRVLEVEGYRVMEAPDGPSGLEMAASQRPDLVLMDINLPDMDGYEVTGRMRCMPDLDGVPIVALTANVMRGAREQTIDAGCDGYLQKPIDIDALPLQISAFLSQGRAGNERT